MSLQDDSDSVKNINNEIDDCDFEWSQLKRAIDLAVLKEMKGASDVVTKHTINLRVYKKIAKLLNVNVDIGIDPKSISIHPDVMIKIDDKWKKNIQNNFQVSHEEMNAYDKIKSTDYVKIPDVAKFIAILIRKDIVEREDKEKIIKSNDLNIVLGVDGFLGYTPVEMKNYIENLKFGHDGDSHVETVRNMYSLDIIKNLSGTDAASIVFLALISAYKRFISDDQAKLIIDSVESDTKSYLSKNAKYFHDINNAIENIDELVDFYTENVPEISRISVVKVADLISKSKKRKSPTAIAGKRGRKKMKIACEDDVDIVKKRKRVVKPLVENESE